MARSRSKNTIKSKSEKFFIVADLRSATPERPVIIYENGVVEVPTVLRVRSYLVKQYYRALERNLEHLKYRRRDLRGEFRIREHRMYFDEVLEKLRNQERVSVSKLWKFFYREEVESVINAIMVVLVHKKWSTLIRKALREKDRQFLESIGYVKKAKA